MYNSVTKKNIDEVIRKYFIPKNMFVYLVREHLTSLTSIETSYKHLFP
jgi:hypothetical protein